MPPPLPPADEVVDLSVRHVLLELGQGRGRVGAVEAADRHHRVAGGRAGSSRRSGSRSPRPPRCSHPASVSSSSLASAVDAGAVEQPAHAAAAAHRRRRPCGRLRRPCWPCWFGPCRCRGCRCPAGPAAVAAAAAGEAAAAAGPPWPCWPWPWPCPCPGAFPPPGNPPPTRAAATARDAHHARAGRTGRDDGAAVPLVHACSACTPSAPASAATRPSPATARASPAPQPPGEDQARARRPDRRPGPATSARAGSRGSG